MKPKKTTILALALAGALTLTAFTACSNGTSGSADTERPQGAGMEAPPGGQGGPGGGGSADLTYTAATEISAADTQENQNYASSTADESALLIATADSVTISNPTVTKSGDSDGGDNCNFYGLNAAVLVKDGANVTITGGTVNPTLRAQTASSATAATADRTARAVTARQSPSGTRSSRPPATDPAAS